MRPARPRLVAGISVAALVLCLATAPASGQEAEDAADLLRGSQGETLPVPSAGAQPEAPTNAPDTAEAEAESGSDQPSPSDIAYGAFQRGFYLSALKLAEPIAKLGDPAAQTLLGEIYSRGLGVPQDLKAAARWYEAAAKAGSAEGQFRYAMMLLHGSVVPRDVAKAHDLMRAAADAGLPLAQYNFAQMLIEAAPSGGFDEALGYFEKAANAGVADAQYAMAQLYLYGRAVTADPAKARSWLRAAAINGHRTAQVEYGIWLINGKGGKALPEDGFLFLKFAAERGNPIAINRLAHLYKDGIGTEPDRAEAAKWALLAKRAENSDPELDDFFRGLDAEAQKKALEAANRGYRG